MNIRDIYGNILRELDRYQSPSFEVHEFNYFFPKAVDAVILEAYRMYKDTQSVSDTIRFYTDSKITATGYPQQKGDRSLDLEPDARYVLTVYGNFIRPKAGCSDSEKLFVKKAFYLEEADELDLPSITANSYLSPKVEEDRAYFTVEGRKLNYMFEGDGAMEWNIEKLKYTFVRDPDHSQFVLPVNFINALLPELEIPVKIIRKFIDRAVLLFLENSTNPRLQTHTTINQ